MAKAKPVVKYECRQCGRGLVWLHRAAGVDERIDGPYGEQYPVPRARPGVTVAADDEGHDLYTCPGCSRVVGLSYANYVGAWARAEESGHTPSIEPV